MKTPLSILLCLSYLVLAPPELGAFSPIDVPTIGFAYLTNLATHEMGHYVEADECGVKEKHLRFFAHDDGSTFLGYTHVGRMEKRCRVSYQMGGEIFSSQLFELALRGYRKYPSLNHKALLLFSGTDFLWYNLYSFYINPSEEERFDPVGVSQITGLSGDQLLLISLLQTGLNGWRVYSGQDRFIPYFAHDRYMVSFMVKTSF